MSSRRLIYATTVLIGAWLFSLLPLPCCAADGKRIVFLAGRPSHGYGSHEHLAGCRVLADAIQRAAPGTKCDVYSGGWPESDDVLAGADTIIMYCDGGKGHPAIKHLPAIQKQMDRGVGFVCLHYGVEVPKEDAGPQFLEWLGGYFEMQWSVNPHWVAEYKSFPNHPITRGVKPFSANDEWYFHMRFRPEMKGVTPILSAVPPASTMTRPDGPHSGNAAVREEVAKGLPQHMAWAYERENGGRSFGFTGGHFHWNWGRPEIITLVTNAICWTAKMDIPEGGLKVTQPTVETLKEGQDEPIPDKFDAAKIKDEFKLTSTGAAKSDALQAAGVAGPKPRLIYSSPVVNSQAKGHRIDAEVNLTGVKKLFLVVNDAGDGFGCDWADWLEPTLIKGDARKDLTELNWTRAETDWGSVQKNKNANGGTLVVGGKEYAKGIGTHANSVIAFDLDGTWEKLKVGCGVDVGGTGQNGGGSTSVKFAVYADAAPRGQENSNPGTEQHSAENAIAGLDIHPELSATLAASEPKLLSLTNLDVDYRGRVWVCEVVNYRRHNGERSEGDRILILEDTNQDGVMDKETVYFQGREVDSAMGICVLGNRVIVSASPNVWVFTDDNGDDKPDRKELLFTKTGDPQHDHSAHSFSFGPDGKLYWNFGNTGKQVHDAKGDIVRDIAGNEVRDTAKPYRQGMPFRCNLDGSQFEVLGYNFRNNYEVAVDSFGALWQSDNDDDGNRATRINFVMEFGNYGYVDEVTGEGWRVERTNMENEIPLQHWHLNDPGVVPTMLITGAGSPTGITVYEGELLPKVFRNQVIHCDAGPNVVRAYPASPEGAGYKADIVNMMVGERDRWFRPADVCTAPDGSLYVTDWYDPGVGGHNMQDMERGRLFRLAPPNTKYNVPQFDFNSPTGAVAALANPAGSVRYLAWEAIQKFGDAAMPALSKMASDSNPRMRARAIWAIGKLSRHGEEAVRLAIKDEDPNVRMVAIRLARQLEMPATSYAQLLRDPSAAVRREFAVALHLDKSSDMPKHWAELASQYDGQDRWYLEALGIGAGLRWSECFDAYTAKVNSFDTPAARDIAWRARCPKAAQTLVQLINNPKVSDSDVAKYLRGLDFQAPEDRDAAVKSLLAAKTNSEVKQSRQDLVLVECLSRAGGESKLTSDQQEAVTRYLKSSTNRAQQLKVIRQLKLPTTVDLLVEMVLSAEPDSQSVAAMEMLLRRNNTSGKLIGILTDKNRLAEGTRMSTAIGMCKFDSSWKFIEESFENTEVSGEAKAEMAKGLAQNDAGGRWLIERAKNGKLPGSARLIVGSKLRASNNPEIRKAASELFPAPKSAAKEPLPSITELVARKGKVDSGLQVFKVKGTCANCHIVAGQGKNVGPDLTEIGSKLSREAMLVSILDPSAGISHNFENYAALTEDGNTINGLLVSKTDAQVVLKDAQGIERTIASADLAQFKKLEKSLMPENLHEALTTDELVDLIEYLMTLRKK